MQNPGEERIKRNKSLRSAPVESTENQWVHIVSATDKPKWSKTVIQVSKESNIQKK